MDVNVTAVFSIYGTIWPICAENAVKPPTNQPIVHLTAQMQYIGVTGEK